MTVAVGEEFHYLTELSSKGGEVTLVKARAFLGPAELETDPPRLLRRTGQRQFGYGIRGPVTVPHDVVGLTGARISPMDSFRGVYALDLVLRPTAVGEFRVDRLEVTYIAGFLRTRTATIKSNLCLRVTADGRNELAAMSQLCAGTRP